MSDFNPCFLIPCYNHGSTIATVVNSLQVFNLPIMIIDDGSNSATKKALQALVSRAAMLNVNILTLDKNQGKGGAVKAGLQKLQQQSFSHAIQIDADGQHDLQTVPALLNEARQYPNALISGQPIYDESVPKSRLYGRYATHIWVWIETLSFAIKDSMCGFRAYPIKLSLAVTDKHHIGSRMDFDTEIMVRLYWNGTDVRFIPTRVIYPENGISHFDTLWDNLKISMMHTRLFFGMLPRIPRLMALNFGKKKHLPSQLTTNNQHWSATKEQGTILGIKTLLWVYRKLGRKAFRMLLKPVIGYYYLFGSRARNASQCYLHQVDRYSADNGIAQNTKFSSYQHLLSFGETMLDKLAAWQGDYNESHLRIFGQQHAQKLIRDKQGIVILGSHLGNIELCRALSHIYPSLTINALVFTEHAEQFNRVMKAVNPDSSLNLIQVSTIDPATAILLQQKLDQGEWVVIVGDRTSATQEQRVIWADFLGKPAPFSQGPFLLTSVLKVPVYLLFCFRNNDHFDVYFEPFSECIKLPRHQRQQALEQNIEQYAERLTHFTLMHPLQWHNYFNFWQLTERKHDN